MNTYQYQDLRVYIGFCADREMVENFVKDKKEYFIEGDNVYCCDLDSKVELKRFLVFNDSYYSSNSDYCVLVNYKSKGEEHYYSKNYIFYPDELIYIPDGDYLILIDNPQWELQNTKWDDDYVTSENFVNKRNIAFFFKNCIVEEKKYSSLNLKKILSYFEDGQRFGFNFNREGIYVLDRESPLFDDFSVSGVTITAFLIKNGFFVYHSDISGHMIIDLY